MALLAFCSGWLGGCQEPVYYVGHPYKTGAVWFQLDRLSRPFDRLPPQVEIAVVSSHYSIDSSDFDRTSFTLELHDTNRRRWIHSIASPTGQFMDTLSCRVGQGNCPDLSRLSVFVFAKLPDGKLLNVARAPAWSDPAR